MLVSCTGRFLTSFHDTRYQFGFPDLITYSFVRYQFCHAAGLIRFQNQQEISQPVGSHNRAGKFRLYVHFGLI